MLMMNIEVIAPTLFQQLSTEQHSMYCTNTKPGLSASAPLLSCSAQAIALNIREISSAQAALSVQFQLQLRQLITLVINDQLSTLTSSILPTHYQQYSISVTTQHRSGSSAPSTMLWL